MRKLSILTILWLAIACQSTPGDLATKKELLAGKEKELATLKDDIVKLKKEIAELDTAARDDNSSITPVKVKEMKSGTFEHFVQITGTVTSKQNVLISSEAGGQVERIDVTEGDKVRKGQVLVRIENDAISNQLQEAQAVYDLAETTYQKRQKLWDQSIGSEIEYLQAKNNYETAKSRLAQVRSNYNNTFIKSPINGNVDVIEVNQGEFVGMGTPVVRVVDVENVEIEAELSEQYLASVKKGDSVKVTIPALGYSQRAIVDFVSQVINPDNRSFTVKVKLSNKGGLIKPNALANIMIRDYASDSALVVPSSSIGKDLKGDYVFVVVNEDGGKVARKSYISKGKSFGPNTEILDGISAGDEVITAGSSEVNEGENIAIQ